MKRFAYIDALRGYAILMVIAVHASQHVEGLPPWMRTLADQGARGVQLFFVASALTLCLSWQARHDGALAFYLRRLFRIAPMFWLAIIYFVVTDGFGPRGAYAPDGIGVRQIVLAALFLHGLMPDAITSIVPGSWSIADEAIFYLIFPLLFAVNKRLQIIYAFLATIIISCGCIWINHLTVSFASRIPGVDMEMWASFIFLWFPSQLVAFLAGMLVFKVGERMNLSPSAGAIIVLASIAVFAAVTLLPDQRYIDAFKLSLFAAAFFLLALGLKHWQPTMLVNPMIGWVGKVSYSAYFLHFAILEAVAMPSKLSGSSLLNYALTFLTLTIATLAAASITYIAIERPTIGWGARLIARIASNDEGRQALSEAPAPRRS
jgi:peptidoglycan/LPS O-acetylase OafA/YrhL